MIELGALLGAVAAVSIIINFTFNFHLHGGGGGSVGCLLWIVFVVPVFGALWGAGIATIIHFVANGTALNLMLGTFVHHAGGQ